MRLDEFTAPLDGVRRSGFGVMACCPAHEDASQSLSVKEGERTLLVRCFAGCTLDEITAAMGVRVGDLFYDGRERQHERRVFSPKPRLDLNRIAFRLCFHADLLHLRAQAVLDAAAGLDVATWDDEGLARALNAVASAYADRERGALLDSVALRLRWRTLNGEARHAA